MWAQKLTGKICKRKSHGRHKVSAMRFTVSLKLHKNIFFQLPLVAFNHVDICGFVVAAIVNLHIFWHISLSKRLPPPQHNLVQRNFVWCTHEIKILCITFHCKAFNSNRSFQKQCSYESCWLPVILRKEQCSIHLHCIGKEAKLKEEISALSDLCNISLYFVLLVYQTFIRAHIIQQWTSTEWSTVRYTYNCKTDLL